MHYVFTLDDTCHVVIHCFVCFVYNLLHNTYLGKVVISIYHYVITGITIHNQYT